MWTYDLHEETGAIFFDLHREKGFVGSVENESDAKAICEAMNRVDVVQETVGEIFAKRKP